MADNTTLNTMTGGDLIASDAITDGGVANGAKAQRVKAGFGGDGSYTDVSSASPLPTTQDSGTLLQRIELLEMVLRQLLSGAGGQPHDGFGRTFVRVDAMASGLTLATVSTVGTVSTVSKVGLLSLSPDQMLISQSNSAALALRDRITVT